MNILECQLCNKIFKNIRGLTQHIFQSHKQITRETYFNTYIRKSAPICKCGKYKKFRNISIGYGTYCSQDCSNKYQNRIGWWLNKKQPEDMIQKRIKNTNQKNKEIRRKKTCLEKYGMDNPSKIGEISKKISISNTGQKQFRTAEHQKKIIKSKRKNNNLQHSETTKQKIQKTIQKLYQSDNPPVTISNNNNKNHKFGYFNNLYYRSSYELKFIKYCFKNKIILQSAESKLFRCCYFFNNKKYWYYPDFYLPEYNLIIEIKPSNFLSDDKTIAKLDAGMRKHSLTILDEEYIDDLDSFFNNYNIIKEY